MEEIFESAKENVIGPIKCSPVLPSAQERFGVNQVSSPLSVLKESQHENIFYSPDSDSFPKITRFLSTPVPKDPDYKIVTNSWDEIRKLDEEELWIERTQVVTKEDHILYSEVAKEAVNSIIEKLPIRDMDDSVSDAVDSSLQESANETVVCVEKEEDAAADENVNDPDFTSLVAASDEAVVSDEKKEETETDIKTIRLDTESMQLPDQHLDKSVLEDNAFIHSCSDLDETVKEILADEEPVSPKKFDDIEDSNSDIDNDKTICNDQATENTDVNSDQATFQSQFDDESFKPAAGADFALELDYLENIGSSDDADHMSDLARQSLYVKFDPLVNAQKEELARPVSNGLSEISPADLLFPGPISGSDLLGMDTPPKEPVQPRALLSSKLSSEEQKPSEVASDVAPVDNLFNFSPSQKTTCDAIETDNDRKSQNNVTESSDESSLVQPLLYSSKDLEKAVLEEKEKLTKELQTQWKEETALLELEIVEKTTKMEKLRTEANKAHAEIHEMKAVMLEYEQTMAQMIEDREKDKSHHEKSNLEIIQERDQLQHDLHNTEKSFAHLHQRFEKLKTAVEGYRKNEEILKKAVKDLQENLRSSQEKYQLLKKHAEEKLHGANVEMTRVQSNNKAEVAALQAALKREKAKNSSLQQNLDQKISENRELTAICDELISKVGTATQ